MTDETVTKVENDASKYGVSHVLVIWRPIEEFVLRYNVFDGHLLNLKVMLN